MTQSTHQMIDSSAMRESLAISLIEILNSEEDIDTSIEQILQVIKHKTGFDAVGIRLRSGDDFPYYSQEGFSQDFLLSENTLVVRDKQGSVCRNEDGTLCLECTCGVVLSGRTDPANPLFTEGGSAWTNASLTILNVPAKEDPRLHPRNRCIHDGYMSIALIPIRTRKDIVGLLQLNDRRKDCFTPGLILFLEALAQGIGIALMRIQDETARKKAEEDLQLKALELEKSNQELQTLLDNVKTLRGLLPICASCKKIRDDKGYWNQIENYISDRSEVDFSHGICPDCAKELYPGIGLYDKKNT
jgi:GAF domain-containing protein